jgi:hypothetical protein
MGFAQTALLRDADNDHFIALENVPAGAVICLPETPANTFLLDKTTDSSFFRYEKIGGAWQIAMRLATFVIDSLKSKARGFLHVFHSGQVASDKPVFEVNPAPPPADGSSGKTYVKDLLQVGGGAEPSKSAMTARSLASTKPTASDSTADRTRTQTAISTSCAAERARRAPSAAATSTPTRFQRRTSPLSNPAARKAGKSSR